MIIHIGFHKTGSTALQEFLFAEREALATRGIIIPPGLSSWLGHPELSWICQPERLPWQDRDYDPDAVLAHYRPYLELSRSPETTVILTSEEFCRLEFRYRTLSNVRDHLGAYQPIIVAFFRNPMKFLLSRYRHEVQNGYEPRALKDFILDVGNLLSAKFDFRCQAWDDAFDERGLYRNYDLLDPEVSIVDHFFQLIDVHDIHQERQESDESKLDSRLLDMFRGLVLSELPREQKSDLMGKMFVLSDMLEGDNMGALARSNIMHAEFDSLFESLANRDIATERRYGDLLAGLKSHP
ncbi:hypothetical protein BTR14_07500 [Rhizobium rhizosphaerae]|uniref:Sulfotransferase n=1 Tax=Xaviernesmea rhizosphaerae TaxID=1672749 RepID=A0ABX3PGQ7_9HYPH|nr:hypothetical protein BTR14_07500 [Xaviernesmea rhizosphaerae]